MGFLAEVASQLDANSSRIRSGIKAPKTIPDLSVIGAPQNGNPLALSDTSGFDGFQHFKGWCYVVVNHIASRIAGQPIRLGEIVRDGQEPTISRSAPRPAKDYMPERLRAQTRLMFGEQIAVINDGELADVLERPNRMQSRYDLVYITVCNLLMTGEAYVLGGSTKRGEPPELYAVPTNWVKPEHKGRLFSNYWLRPHPNKEGVKLDAEQVARIYLPDPTDPRGCVSPIWTQMRAVHVDDHIQASQEMAFENGIFPTLALHVGRVGGKETGPRKLLQPHQRRQLISAVRKIYGGVARSGEPMILDALIEEVSQITRAPREMDWNQSAQMIKTRLFQAFSLNPVAVGEITGVNRANAVVAERHHAQNVLNPLLEKLTTMVNNFVVPMFYPPEQADMILAWFEAAVVVDEEQRASEYADAARMGFVSKSEFRRERLGLAADTDTDQSVLLANPQAMVSVTNLFKAVTAGTMPHKTAALIIAKFLGMPLKECETWVNAVEVVEEEEVQESGAEEISTDVVDETVRGLKNLKASGVTKPALIAHRKKQIANGESEVASVLEKFFLAANSDVTEHLKRLETATLPE